MMRINVSQKNYVRIYLFGSAVYSDKPSDIDVAIIYDKKNVTPEEILKFRRYLEQDLFVQTNLCAEAILLSDEEEVELEFLKNARHILL